MATQWQNVEVEIKGTGGYGLLMNKFDIQGMIAEQGVKKVTSKAKSAVDFREEAENAAYWSETSKKKDLVIPALNIYSCILRASSFHKIGKRSAKAIIAGSVKVEPTEVSLGTAEFEVDIRSVKNRSIGGGRILKARPRLKDWKAKFTLVYNKQLITSDQIIKTILEEAGQRVGLMDFRPENGGPFGTFEIKSWKLL